MTESWLQSQEAAGWYGSDSVRAVYRALGSLGYGYRATLYADVAIEMGKIILGMFYSGGIFVYHEKHLIMLF